MNGASLHQTADQALTNGAETILQWGGADFDTGGWWSALNPERITVPANVHYIEITANLWVPGYLGNGPFDLYLAKNGAVGATFLPEQKIGSAGVVQIASGPLSVAHLDYFDVRCFIEAPGFNSGSAGATSLKVVNLR